MNRETLNKENILSESVTARYNNTTRTNHRLLALILDRGFKTIQSFADEMSVSRSLISQIIHYHKEPSEEMKIMIAKKLETDSRVIFPND